MKKRHRLIVTTTILIFSFALLKGVTNDWKITVLNNPAPGYIKMDWFNSDVFCMFDNYGNKQYNSNPEGFVNNNYFKLLKNGYWIADGWRVPGIRKYYLFNQDMVVVDSIPISTDHEIDFHDVEVLSNGHYLLLYTEKVIVDMSKIVDGGRPDAEIFNSIIVETDRSGTIYWTWKTLDHHQITDATYDIDLTQPQIDFAHINSFIETPDGNLLISFRHMDEIDKINKTSGDIIWRLGGENCRNNQFTFTNDENGGYTGFSHQHSVTMLNNGNILLFDNGNLKYPQYTRAVEYSINFDNKTVTKVWEYRNSPDIYTSSQGSAYRLSNGNTLINWAVDKITEVKQDNTIAFEMVFTYLNPSISGSVYRAYRIVTRMNAVTKSINGIGDYIFNNQDNTTGITLNLNYVSKGGNLTVEKHNYPAPEPEMADSTFTGFLPYRWVISCQGVDSIAGNIRFDASKIEIPVPYSKVRIYKRSKESAGEFKYLKTNYNSATNEITAKFTGFGEFIACVNNLNVPKIMYPLKGSSEVNFCGAISWDTVSKAEGYRVQVSRDSLFRSADIDSIVMKRTSMNYNNLYYSTIYFIRVKAFNPGDTSEWSDVVNFKTDRPIAVKLLNPSNNLIGVNISDNLNWEGIPGGDKYQLQVSGLPDFSLLITDTIINSKSFYQQGLNYNTIYYWRVKAYQGKNSGNWSAEFRFTTVLPAPVHSFPPNDTINQPLTGTLYWNTVASSLSYQLEISLESDFKPVLLSAKNIIERNYQYENFDPNTYYYWRIRACRSYDSSSWSQPFRFKTRHICPDLVMPLNGASNLLLKVEFNWVPIKSIASYMFQLSTDSKFSNCIIDSVYLDKPVYIAKNLPPDKQLFWRIAANYSDTTGIWSETRSFTTGNKLLPSTPQLVSPENNSREYIEGTMKWLENKRPDKIRLQIAKDAGFDIIAQDTIIFDTTIYNFANLDFDTKYYWRARSIFDSDSSNWSEVRYFVTITNFVTLLYPDNELTQVSVSDKFEWITIPGINEFQIQVSLDSVFSKLQSDTLVKGTNTLQFCGLEFNKPYYWRARYVKNEKFSNWSKINRFITESELPLETPALLIPENESYGIHADGILSWNCVDKATIYNLVISKDMKFDKIINNQNTMDCFYKYTGLEHNCRFYWRVTAFNDDNSSRWSEIRSFITELIQPLNVSPVNGSDENQLTGSLIWQKDTGADSYKLQVSGNELFSELDVDTTITGDTLYKYYLAPSKEYFWKVKAICDKNFSQWSLVSKFRTTGKDLGVNNQDDEIWVLYPIPAEDYLEVAGDIFPSSKYEVFSIEGQLVLAGTLDSKRINLMPLAPGCYLIRTNSKFQLFIKQ